MKSGFFCGWAAAAMVCLLAHCSTMYGAAANDAPVVVTYSDGETQVGTVKQGEVFYIDRDYRFGPVSSEISGLQFTRRKMNISATATIDAPAGAKVDLMLGNGGAAGPGRDAAVALGFMKIDSPRLWQHGTQEGAPASLYSQTFPQAKPHQHSRRGDSWALWCSHRT